MTDLTRIAVRDLARSTSFVWPELLALVGLRGAWDPQYGDDGTVFELTHRRSGSFADAPHGFVPLQADIGDLRVFSRLPLAVVEAASTWTVVHVASVYTPPWAAPWVCGRPPGQAVGPHYEDVHALRRLGAPARAELGSTFHVGGATAYWAAYAVLTGRGRPNRYTPSYSVIRPRRGTPVAP